MIAGYLGAKEEITLAKSAIETKQSPIQKALVDAWNGLTLPQAQAAVSNLVKRLSLKDQYEKGYFAETGKQQPIEVILAEYGKSKAALLEIIDGMNPDEPTRIIIMEELAKAGVTAKQVTPPATADGLAKYMPIAIVAAIVAAIWYFKSSRK